MSENKLSISAQVMPSFNYALHFNRRSLIQNVRIINRSNEPIDRITLRVVCDVPVFDKVEVMLPEIPARFNDTIGEIPLQVNAKYLAGLTEAVNAIVTLNISDDDQIISSYEHETRILPFDQSADCDEYPQFLASFITPNHPAIPSILHDASDILAKWGKDPSLEGYQDPDPNRIRDFVAAIFGAIQKKNIAYSNPPTTSTRSWTDGQRIRTVDAVLDQRLATCMDFTLLFASCIEAMHLHPILCLIEGHIFSGVWLTEDAAFDAPVIDDVKEIKTRMDNGHDELVLVECTAMKSGDHYDFDDAVKHSNHKDLSANKFESAVDVHLARMSGVKPLPSRVLTDHGYQVEANDLSDDEITKAPSFHNLLVPTVNSTHKKQMTKQDVWEGKLLDLSLKNILLNLPKSASVMPLMASKIDEIEDAIASGEEFKLTTIPEQELIIPLDDEGAAKTNVFWIFDTPLPFCYNEDIANPPRPLIDYWFKQYSSFAQMIQKEAKKKGQKIDISEEQLKKGFAANLHHWLPLMPELLSRNHAKHRLHSFYDNQEELDKCIEGLYRTARTSKQENGISSLYLSLGLMRWFELEDKEYEKPHYAPLLLVPIEIVRKSAGQGYSFYRRDEDTVLNPALMEMLRQTFNIDITGLDPLPCDQSGVDVRLILSIIKQAIIGMENWECFNTALIGNFSFAQFAMWNDIHTSPDALEKSDIVRSLMKGHVDWDTASAANVPEDQQVYLPINVDATQLEAIRMAAAGNTFVLHGPPGTGKSQTITAMIANAVAHGKSVLFVAEKMAALSVVDRRLTGLGIGDFCIELHSDKANKKHLLEQLERALNAAKDSTGASYPESAKELSLRRDQLDAYAQHLYEARPCGFSLRELVDQYDSFAENLPSVLFSTEEANAIQAEQLRSMPELLDGLAAAGNAIGTVPGNPLLGTGLTSYTSEVRSQSGPMLEQYSRVLLAAQSAGKVFAELIGISDTTSKEAAEKLAAYAQIFLTNAKLDISTSELLTSGNQESEVYLSEYEAVAGERKKLLEKVDYEMLGINVDDLLKEHQAAAKKLFGKAKAIAAVEERIKSHCYQSVSYDSIPALLEEIRALQQKEKRVRDKLHQVPERFHEAIKRFETVAAYRKAATDVLQARSFPGGRSTITLLAKNPNAQDAAAQYADAWKDVLSVGVELNALLMRVPEVNGDDFFASEMAFCRKLTDDPSSLKEWVLYQNKRNQCTDHALLPSVKAYESGMRPDVLVEATRKGLFYTLINDIIGSDPVLGTFSGATFNESVQQFRRLDEALLELAKAEIKNRLAENLPNGTESPEAGKELNLLRKAIQSGGRGLSIRAMLDMLPTILPRLCPCMLMSPNSVAQYLSHNLPLFDVVIFDEASQLPTCKAVGALSRAKSAVVVGDPKQMPPTSFFSGSGPDVDDLSLEDLDSILDDCLALGIPSRYLQWHYRSRHESLIAFSNSEFYENKMFTFPSANDRERHVNVVYVDGEFERNKGRCNRKEAEAIVREVIRRYQSKKLRKYSVGIVTFNMNQQKVIEDMLGEAFRQDSGLDAWANTGDDPLFVKNLENVQGDERDIILFSIGYGPDADGHVSMNFGPINQDGGWKRLNVAFSRSRVAMTIFSSLHPEQIDLRRTSSEGVAALRDFLLFAEGRQPASISGKQHGGQKSGIISSIRKLLETNGYQVETMIGHSDFHVDMAVVDPGDPTKYLLGILLDGDTYRSTTYTRDREVAQESVLKGLGWKLHRIWTIDWWDARGKEQDKLLKLLTQRKEEAELQRQKDEEQEKAEPVNTPAEPKQPQPTPEAAPPKDEDPTPKKKRQPAVTHNLYSESEEEEVLFPRKPAAAKPVAAIEKAEASSNAVPATAAPSENRFGVKPYAVTELETVQMNSEVFCAPESQELIRSRIGIIVQCEAPIAKELLVKRLLRSYGIQRSNAAILETADKLIDSANLKYTKNNGMLFYWTSEQNPMEWRTVREIGDRTVELICKQELRSALCVALQQSGAMTQDILFKETSKVLGYARLTQQMRDAFEKALTFAKNSGEVILRDDATIVLSGK